MSEAIKLNTEVIKATMKKGNLVADEGSQKGNVLITTGKGIGRQVNTLKEGATITVAVEGSTVTEILVNELRDEHAREYRERDEAFNDFANELRARRIDSRIGADCHEHKIPGGEGRRDHLDRVVAKGQFHLVHVSDDTFKLIIDMAGPTNGWLVTARYTLTKNAIDMTITHFGPGSAY